jgi:uncharacterized protein
MSEKGPRGTYVGWVASVLGGVVRVRLRSLPSTLVMVGGQSFRVGQIGAFLRIPLGYTSLYGVCTQVGADAAPPSAAESTEPLPKEPDDPREGYRWLTMALFGESIGGHFDRGVGQYPTVGDPVHLVTERDMVTIYGEGIDAANSIEIGRIASSSGLAARLQLANLVSRHSCVVGSTGAGKSNLVAVVLDALADDDLPRARCLVIDAHGEYASALGDKAHVISAGIEASDDAARLRVPYWALPFEELFAMVMGQMQPQVLQYIRDRVAEMKREAAAQLPDPPPEQTITADSPVPFSIRRLWFELELEQRATYTEAQKQDESTRLDPEVEGSAKELRPPRFPAPTSYNSAPYAARGIKCAAQLDLLHSRLEDQRFSFMFDPDDPLHPDLDGKVGEDLDSLLAEWVGNEKPVTILDVSGLPPEVLATVVGTLLRVVYDALFWAMELPVGGRLQPLLVLIDEAHRFLPKDADTPANRAVGRIAKEGRKYGVGLMVVSQRPSDIDAGVLSQCGTMIALRVTNGSDRAAVLGALPDDLGGLGQLLPSLRTGEALVLGDALQVPSRVRIRLAPDKPHGGDPGLPGAWRDGERPDPDLYKDAVANWRSQTTRAPAHEEADR